MTIVDNCLRLFVLEKFTTIVDNCVELMATATQFTTIVVKLLIIVWN